MRSTFFVFLSLAFHALCVAAVALAPAKLAGPGTEVEMVVEDPVLKPGIEVAEAEVIQAPEPVLETKPVVKVQAKVETKLPAKKKTVAKAEPKVEAKKVVKTDFTELPAKEVTSEDLGPELADENTVAVVPAAKTESKKEVKEESDTFIPVKEKVAGVEAMATDEDTEATTKEIDDSEEAPEGDTGATHEENPLSEQVKGSTPVNSAKGAVSYLDLKQQAGNKGPNYPLQARKEGRQGQVELLYRVTKEGNVADLKIAKSSGHKDLDQEAVRAVTAFHFVPGQEGWARHPVNFALKGSADVLPSRLRASSAQTE